MSNPTNKDVLDAILKLDTKVSIVDVRLQTVEEQTKKTNGRVTSMEEWRNAIQAVEEYKSKEVPKTINMAKKNNLDAQSKLFLSAAALITVITTAIAIWSGKL